MRSTASRLSLDSRRTATSSDGRFFIRDTEPSIQSVPRSRLNSIEPSRHSIATSTATSPKTSPTAAQASQRSTFCALAPQIAARARPTGMGL
ncbi:MAG: hypothetical protein MUC63_01965 [Planctomycetes bacterium]|nr:hypothetical protein [Planctomycetota bacterium]